MTDAWPKPDWECPGMRLYCGDSLPIMATLPQVDLVFTSPPYEDARYYGELDFRLKDEAWVTWFLNYCITMSQVCPGLCAAVVQGRTREFQWSATPARLVCRLADCGLSIRNPPIYHRVSIAGSGGPDWLRSDYEWIVCWTAKRGHLPWSDNTACGHLPKWPPGGEMSHRMPSGRRVARTFRQTRADGHQEVQGYIPPELANPGNVITGTVGKGHMGHDLAHENEAPFPLWLAEFFVRSFCPPGGTVLDPFAGSGTVGHAALLHRRQAVLIEARESQCSVIQRRLTEVAGRIDQERRQGRMDFG